MSISNSDINAENAQAEVALISSAALFRRDENAGRFEDDDTVRGAQGIERHDGVEYEIGVRRGFGEHPSRSR